MAPNPPSRVRFEATLHDGAAYQETLRRAAAYAETRGWSCRVVAEDLLDGLEIAFDPRLPALRLLFDRRLKTRGATATERLDAATHGAVLGLFDVLEPYCRLLVVEERHHSGPDRDAHYDPDFLLRFCRALDDPAIQRLAAKGSRRFRQGPRLVAAKQAAA